MTALQSVAPNGMSRDVAKQTNIDLHSNRIHTRARTHTHTEKHTQDTYHVKPLNSAKMDELTLQHQSLLFFAQLNLLIHFACKPICLSSRSQTVSCPHCSAFSCTVYFSPFFALLSLNDKAISRAFAPWEIEGISVHTFIPPFLKSLPQKVQSDYG